MKQVLKPLKRKYQVYSIELRREKKIQKSSIRFFYLTTPLKFTLT